MLDKAKMVYWCGATYKSVAIRLYIRNMYFVLFFPGPYVKKKWNHTASAAGDACSDAKLHRKGVLQYEVITVT